MSDQHFAGWLAYADAVVDVFIGDAVVTLGQEGLLEGVAPPAPMLVLTAYNPGRAVASSVNEAAQAHLIEYLSQRSLSWLPAIGRSRDGTWQEPSLAVTDLPEPEAIEIARRFDQDAIFKWDGENLSVISCKSGAN